MILQPLGWSFWADTTIGPVYQTIGLGVRVSLIHCTLAVVVDLFFVAIGCQYTWREEEA